MNKLAEARHRIDAVDKQLLELIRERMDIAEDVAVYKSEHGLPVLDERREQQVVDDRVGRAAGLGLPEGAGDVFRTLIRMSRERQEEMIGRSDAPRRAAFQGVRGANSHLALVRFLGGDMESASYATFEEVFEAVSSGEAVYGVLPIENSFAGSVVQVLDLLQTHDVHIIGEKSLPIDHMLAALPGTDVNCLRTVYSHEQAIAQCASFFRDNPQIEAQPYYNTAGAAEYVAASGDPTKAALCNEYAAQLYGLEILQPSVNTSRDNTTRFILIAAKPYAGGDADKASVSFGLAHQPGSLAQALTHFSAHGLNMVKIESRPLKDRSFEYRFYCDFEGAGVRDRLEEAIKAESVLFSDVRLLGAYVK